MQLVLSTNQLSAYGGSETYLVTVAEQLQKLGQLHEQGVLTDAEFEVQKQKILQGL